MPVETLFFEGNPVCEKLTNATDYLRFPASIPSSAAISNISCCFLIIDFCIGCMRMLLFGVIFVLEFYYGVIGVGFNKFSVGEERHTLPI